MYLGVLSARHAGLYIMCTSGAYRSQKRASDPPELELQPVVSHYMALGIKSSLKGSQCS